MNIRVRSRSEANILCLITNIKHKYIYLISHIVQIFIANNN